MPRRNPLALLALVATPAWAYTTLTFTAQWQTGLFTTQNDVGTLNPHVYRPEEFTVNDLVYEGLTAWDATSPGADGVPGTADDFVVSSLATSWTDNKATVLADPSSPYELVFTLKQGK